MLAMRRRADFRRGLDRGETSIRSGAATPRERTGLCALCRAGMERLSRICRMGQVGLAVRAWVGRAREPGHRELRVRPAADADHRGGPRAQAARVRGAKGALFAQVAQRQWSFMRQRSR